MPLSSIGVVGNRYSAKNAVICSGLPKYNKPTSRGSVAKLDTSPSTTLEQPMARRIVVEKGQRFSRLVLIEEKIVPRKNNPVRKDRHGVFQCDCGKVHHCDLRSVTRGATKSCGCYHSEYQAEVGRKMWTKHGFAAGKVPSEYIAWISMKSRCYREKNASYKSHGGRGITVCDAWIKDFPRFFKDMGAKPSPRHQLDRINNDGNYEPDNCRWATPEENMQNTRISKTWVIDGVSYPSSTVAGSAHGVHSATIGKWCKDPLMPNCYAVNNY